MKTKPYPQCIFQTWCNIAGWDYVAQDQEVVKELGWSDRKVKVIRFLCDVGTAVLSPLWWWVEDGTCQHCSEIVWLTLGRLSIVQCTWGCGRIAVDWKKRNGITVTLFQV